MRQEKQLIIKNLQQCPHFNSCSQNLCPLDLDLNLRNGKKQDKCRWMREPKTAKIAGREFVSGGSVMPNALLNLVSESNLKWCNEASKNQWFKIRKK